MTKSPFTKPVPTSTPAPQQPSKPSTRVDSKPSPSTYPATRKTFIVKWLVTGVLLAGALFFWIRAAGLVAFVRAHENERHFASASTLREMADAVAFGENLAVVLALAALGVWVVPPLLRSLLRWVGRTMRS